MRAIILSAGEGKRLRPITDTIPKVMIDVLGKPLIEHTVLLLKKNNIKDIFINLFYLPEKVIDYLGNGEKFGVRIIYGHEKSLLGSAGALQNFKHLLKKDFFVLYGDVYIKVDLIKMLKFHKKNKSLFTIAVHDAHHPKDSDLVIIDKHKRVIDWLTSPHKKTCGVNSAGLYIINEKVLKFLPRKIPFDFAHDFIPLLFIKKIPLFAYNTTETMMDIGTLDRYNKLIEKLKK